MPEHTSFLTHLVLVHMKDTLSGNAEALGQTFVGHHPMTWHSFEPVATSILVGLILLVIAGLVRSRLEQGDVAIIPDESLTLRTFVEVFLDYFYNLAKDVMDAERAKKYFPSSRHRPVSSSVRTSWSCFPVSPLRRRAST